MIPLMKEMMAQQVRGERIGSLLKSAGRITDEGADRIAALQAERGVRFGEAARMLGLATEEDVAQALARQFGYPRGLPGQGALSPSLVAAVRPYSAQAEVYRTVRTQLKLRYLDDAGKAIAVIPANDNASASVVAANLAIVLAQAGERTVLVDANLRRPGQGALFGLAPGDGLSDLLIGRAGMEAVQPVEGFGALSVLGAGAVPPNPQELLERPAFGRIGEQLAASHDVVLYDVPCPLGCADGYSVAARCGAALVVACGGMTQSAGVRALRDQLAELDVRLLGAVMVEP